MRLDYFLEGDEYQNLIRINMGAEKESDIIAQVFDKKEKKWIDDLGVCIIFTDHTRAKEITEKEALELIKSM